MRLSVLLLVFCSFHLLAGKTYSQTARLSLDLQQVTIDQVLSEIEKKSEFYFLYNTKLIDVNRKVNIYADNQSIKDILNGLFAHSDVDYVVMDRQIVLSQKEYLSNAKAKLQPRTITGTVTDEKGEPLIGVAVTVKGTTVGTITDVRGKYELQLPSGAVSIVFSYVGMRTQEVPVEDKTAVNVTMVIDLLGLDEVVVIGYGKVKKSDLTGSVASISSDEISALPTSNLTSALQGRVAGVNILQRQGMPGSAAQIRIRGANSLSAGVNDPLYVVDGMILSDLGTSFDFNDIESIQILKDASATAIYGSRGANGVVIITTKRGQSGKPEVGFSTYVGTQKLIKKLDFLQADDFKALYQEAKANATINTVVDNSILTSTENVDWIDEVYRTALIQNYSAYIRGGTDMSKYYSSIGYYGQEGILRNTDFSRLALRFNGDWKINDKLQITNNTHMFYSLRNGTSDYESISNGAAWTRPTQPVKDANSNYTKIELPFPRSNPRALVDLLTNENTGLRLVDNMVLDYEILKGLTIRINAGTEVNVNSSGSYIPMSLSESSYQGNASNSTSRAISWIDENTLNYTLNIGENHFLNALGGITFQKTTINNVGGTSQGFTVDGFKYFNLGAGKTQITSSSYSDYSILSYLGRINYAYKNKYLLTVSGRYDGSSRLSKDNKWAFFPSAALAWRVSEESFLKDNSVISDLKLRVSWGKTGSQVVSPYSSLARFTTVNVYMDGVNPIVGYIPQSVSNNLLGWENTAQTDIGVDLGLLSGKIQLTADYYNKLTSDLIFNRLVPPTSGYSTSVQNIGKVENKGFEFAIISHNFSGKFKWTTNLNLSLNRSKVVDLGKNPAGEDVEMIQQASAWFYLVKDEVPYCPYGYVVDYLDHATNRYVYKDLDNDGDIDVDDQEVLGNLEPKFIFGFVNDMNYKNFDLSLFFQGSIGNDLFVDAITHMTTLNGNNNTLQSVYDNAGTKYRAPNADNDYERVNNLEIFDGTYVRLKELTIGYTVPLSVSEKIKMKNLRVYITGINLLTFDNDYPWYDPETSSGSDIIQGWDRGGYPNNKSVVAGLQLKF